MKHDWEERQYHQVEKYLDCATSLRECLGGSVWMKQCLGAKYQTKITKDCFKTKALLGTIIMQIICLLSSFFVYKTLSFLLFLLFSYRADMKKIEYMKWENITLYKCTFHFWFSLLIIAKVIANLPWNIFCVFAWRLL